MIWASSLRGEQEVSFSMEASTEILSSIEVLPVRVRHQRLWDKLRWFCTGGFLVHHCE